MTGRDLACLLAVLIPSIRTVLHAYDRAQERRRRRATPDPAPPGDQPHIP